MSPPSPGPGPDPGPGSDIQTHGSSPYPQENQEVSESAQQQQVQKRDDASMDTPQPVYTSQSELSQKETEKQDLMKRLQIEPPIARERLTTAPSTFKGVEERKTYTSFGDNGTTASVSAYGHILQISQYFGIGHSGFFCVDLPGTRPPYYSNSRLRDILGKAQSNDAPIGINWKKAFSDSWDFDDISPHLEFVDDRWPRFVSSVPNRYVNDIARNSEDQVQKETKMTSSDPRAVSTLSENFTFSVQYFCHDETIFQKCTLERRPHATADLRLEKLELQADLLIRNLDFTNDWDFNERSRDYENAYDYRLGFDERSLEIVHRITQKSSQEMGLAETEHEKAIVLMITPYVNGVVQPLNLEDEGATMSLDEPMQRQVKEFGVLDVVLAYRLYFEDKTDNKPADFDKVMSKSPMSGHESYEKIDFSSHAHLDFIIRRNLEHILSVCSIPVPPSPRAPSDEEMATSSDDSDSPIALTCGDISGHFTGLAASFYALQFLREMQRYLEDKNSSYANTLRQRIQTTCDRHLKWVFESTEIPAETDEPDQSFAFSPHYWASGRKIPTVSWLRGPSRADTPLQILKIFDNGVSSTDPIMMDIYARRNSRVLSSKAMETLPKRVLAWLQDLDQNDKRKRYAFARASSTNKTKFHLVDHVRISQVLTKLNGVYLYESNEVTEALKRFEPGFVERHILKRFITENPVSRQRTIATSRTASETRFLFHSKDTALFHAMDSWIFSNLKAEASSDEKYDTWKYIIDEWRNTIECQAEHEETRELKWRKPLWYALSFILASKERPINKTSPDVILNTTGRILFGMASPSGLFPGYLTSGQVPMEFDEETYRDNYWQTVFEIPYILWKYGKDKAAKLVLMDNSQSLGVDEMNQETNNSKKKNGFMTKKTQFANSNKLIDPRGLVEISDDWLQQGPEALIFGSDPGFLQSQDSDGSTPVIKPVDGFPSSSEEVVSAGWNSYHSKVRSRKNADSFTDESGKKGLVVDIPRGQKSKGKGLQKTLHDNIALTKRLGRLRDVQLAKKRFIWLPKADKETAMVCCLASPPDEQYELSAFFDRHALYDKYFSDDTSATLNEWKTELQLSFYRLAGFAKLEDFRGEEGIPKFSYVVPQSEDSQRRAMHRNENETPATGIVRAAMGFRFVGDFFDRYWTCYFLEYLPGNPPPKKKSNNNTARERVNIAGPGAQDTSECNSRVASTNMEPIAEKDAGDAKTLKERLSSLKYIQDVLEDPHNGKKKYPWQQRKVLELVLFDQILLHIEKETKDIFNWARVSVLKASGSTEGGRSKYSKLEAQSSVLGLPGFGDNGQPYKMAASDPLNPLSEAIDSAYQFVELGDSEGYFNIIGRWRLFEEILQTLGEDLNENLERIEEWSSRERDREPESPRWTRNDERIFRNTINKLRIQNQRKIRDLERLNASIQTFRDSLTGRLESIREDMSFRGSENMSLFTYVTVIFLPLGFATGIFSMSEAPGRLTLAFMVATAVTSLSITVLALVNAKSLLGLAKRHGKPVMTFVLFALYSCLFVVYAVGAVLRPLFRPIYKHAFKPMLTFLGTDEHLERYKKNLYPIREFDLMNKVSGLVEKERKHDLEHQEGSHGTDQEHTARRL